MLLILLVDINNKNKFPCYFIVMLLLYLCDSLLSLSLYSPLNITHVLNGNTMVNNRIKSIKRTRLSLVLQTLFAGVIFSASQLSFAAEEIKESTAADDYLNLGTELGGDLNDNFYINDRKNIGAQISSFIVPLLAPALTQHAYVLPPNKWRIDISQRHASINGNDFFANGEPDLDTFGDFKVDRQLTDLDLFYGFDLNKKYLHGFTVRLNVPYRNVETDGQVHPNGQPFIGLENAGSDAHLGDVGIFLKKKVLDQANSGFGLAVVGAVFLPTGSNEGTFGSDGRISASRPQPPNLTAAQGFDAVQRANVENGIWGDGRCFFSNFNLDNRELCNNNPSFSAPAAGVSSFAPGGANADNAFVGDFPFNDGVFGRFSDDGRLPAILQSGTGSTSYLIGAFLTRQFDSNSLIGRGAWHAGFSHKFVSESDGIDPGDLTTYFTSFVKPIYKDYLLLDLSLIAFDQEDDSYAGSIPEPEIHQCDADDIGVIPNCGAVGDDAFIFELHERPSFSGGLTVNFAPSIIFNPSPNVRMTASLIKRIKEPDLGPAPDSIFRFALSVGF